MRRERYQIQLSGLTIELRRLTIHQCHHQPSGGTASGTNGLEIPSTVWSVLGREREEGGQYLAQI